MRAPTVCITIIVSFVFAVTSFGCAASDRSPGNDPVAETSADFGETGGQCGGIIGTLCENTTDYCQLAQGECVSVSDAAGQCVVKPEVCTRDYRPVCGCNGKTYPNACEAAAAGTSIALSGACAPGD